MPSNPVRSLLSLSPIPLALGLNTKSVLPWHWRHLPMVSDISVVCLAVDLPEFKRFYAAVQFFLNINVRGLVKQIRINKIRRMKRKIRLVVDQEFFYLGLFCAAGFFRHFVSSF
jgi:hypothetical protein